MRGWLGTVCLLATVAAWKHGWTWGTWQFWFLAVVELAAIIWVALRW